MKLIRITTVLFASVFLLSACHSSKKTYIKKFHKEAKGEVDAARIRLKGDTVRIIYPELTMFDFGKDEIKPEAKTSLQHIAAILAKYDRIDFIINGYTDNVGTDAVNQDLSKRRAESAKTLFTISSVTANRMQTNGMGATNPVMDNATDEGRAANRRVELLLYERK